MIMPIRSWLKLVSIILVRYVCLGSLEVGHDDLKALVLLADQVLYGDLDILEGDICGSARPDTLAVHPPGGDATEATLNEENTDAVHAWATRSDSGSEVFRVDAIGDPLLLSIDDVVFAVVAELGFASDIGHIGTSIRFGDGQTDALVAVYDIWHDPVDECLLTMLDNRGSTDTETSDQVPHEATTTRSRELVSQEQLVEEVPLLRRYALDGILGKVLRLGV